MSRGKKHVLEFWTSKRMQLLDIVTNAHITIALLDDPPCP